MDFGEKLRGLRKEQGLSQGELAAAVGVSLRTVRGWESEGRCPRRQELYGRLAEALHCNIGDLMGQEEAFLTEVSGQYGSRGAAQARRILELSAAMFAGGELSEEDKTAFMDEIQMLYLDSKKRAGKFRRKDYSEGGDAD